MENLLPSIVALQERLSDAGIPSVVIGGVAVAAWGEPRVTRDVDLKVQPAHPSTPLSGQAWRRRCSAGRDDRRKVSASLPRSAQFGTSAPPHSVSAYLAHNAVTSSEYD